MAASVFNEAKSDYLYLVDQRTHQHSHFSTKNEIDHQLEHLLGIDSFIYYLQNYFLYTDTQSYLLAQQRFSEMLKVIASYRLLPLSKQEHEALNSIQQIFQPYAQWLANNAPMNPLLERQKPPILLPADIEKLIQAEKLLDTEIKAEKQKSITLEQRSTASLLLLLLVFILFAGPLLLITIAIIYYLIKKYSGYQSENQLLQWHLEQEKAETSNIVTNKNVQLEQELQIKKNLLQELKLSSSAFESNEAIIITDVNLNIIKVNQAFIQLTGYAQNEVLGQHIRLLNSGLQSAKFYKHLWKILSATGEFRGQVIDLKKNKDLFTANLSIRKVYSSQGNVENYLAHLTNITAYKNSQAALMRRLNIEALVSDIVVNVLSTKLDDFDTVVNESIFLLGQELGVDRSYLFTASEDLKTISNTYEWCSRGTESMQHSLQDIDFAQFPWMKQQLMSHSVIKIDDVALMPNEALAEQVEFERESIQSLLLIPIAKGDSLSGFFGFDLVQKKRGWCSEDIILFRIIADVFHLSRYRHTIEQENNANLQRSLAVSSENGTLLEKNRELTLRMIQAQEQERRFLAQELHDEIGQLLTGMRLDAAYLKDLEHLQGDKEVVKVLQGMYELSTKMISSIRLTTRRIRSATLDQLGLIPALEELVFDWQTHNRGVQVSIDLLENLPPLDEAVMITFYRITQEALTNISKYSQAQHVNVYFIQTLSDTAASLELTISDDGIGFDVDNQRGQAKVKGIGLLGMNERVAALSGQLEITSTHKGTQIKVSIPLIDKMPS